MAESIAKAPVTGVEVRCIDCDHDAATVAQWIDYGYWEFPHLGLFRYLVGVRVINPNHPSAPKELRFDPVSNPAPHEAHFDPATRLVWISAQANVWDCLWHELGHVLQVLCRVLPDGSPAGRALLALYVALTDRTDKPVEYMATDFRLSLFYPAPFKGAKAFFEAVAAAGGI
jgi:hypothetical protein